MEYPYDAISERISTFTFAIALSKYICSVMSVCVPNVSAGSDATPHIGIYFLVSVSMLYFKSGRSIVLSFVALQLATIIIFLALAISSLAFFHTPVIAYLVPEGSLIGVTVIVSTSPMMLPIPSQMAIRKSSVLIIFSSSMPGCLGS